MTDLPKWLRKITGQWPKASSQSPQNFWDLAKMSNLEHKALGSRHENYSVGDINWDVIQIQESHFLHSWHFFVHFRHRSYSSSPGTGQGTYPKHLASGKSALVSKKDALIDGLRKQMYMPMEKQNRKEVWIWISLISRAMKAYLNSTAQ